MTLTWPGASARRDPEPPPPRVQRGSQRDDDARAIRRPLGRRRHRLPLREGARLQARDVAPVGRAVEDEVREQVARHVVEHQRRDDLVRIREGPQHPGDERPERAEDSGGGTHGDDEERFRGRAVVAEPERDPRRTDRAEVAASAPMLKSCMRNAAAAASPVNRIGVAEMSVAERAPWPVKPASTIRR